MPWILQFVSIIFSSAVLVPLLKRLFLLLGVGAITYVGMSALLDVAKDSVSASYGGLTADLIAVLSIAKFDRAINVILSALAARLVLKGLTSSGSLKQVLWRPGQQGSLFP